jgi:hypothetical protein
VITLRVPDDTTDATAWRYRGAHYCPFCLLDAIVVIDIPIDGPDTTTGDAFVLSLATGTAEAVTVTPGTLCDRCAAALPLDKPTLIRRATEWADKFAPGPTPDAPNPA